jgi:nitroreductase
MSCNARHRTEPAPPGVTRREDAASAARRFREVMTRRRTQRNFSREPVPFDVVRDAVATAATAPSGANLQPWRFVVVGDADVKRRLREGAEDEERRFYDSRASEEWLAALEPLGTDWRKGFLEDAPYVIVVFEVHRGPASPRPYYAKESVGIATGFLLAALHQAGLATLTHTPSPMRWINDVLGRPAEERAFVMIPVGWAAEGAQVPAITRKPLEDVLVVV